MVSRRRILSRSGNDLHLNTAFGPEDEEDIWHQKDKLCKDNIQEVLNKWTKIDDEIWAKVIIFERNRRIAKAYARAPVLTINGSNSGFDGFRIGLCGFDNPMRDPSTEEIKKRIGHGVKIKVDNEGNILVKRVSKCNIYVKSIFAREESSIGNDILKSLNGSLELDKPAKLFDISKFQHNMNRELLRSYPDRKRLEFQCLSSVAFVQDRADLLDCPVWVLIINLVAMEMLRSKFSPDIRQGPSSSIHDDDDYYSIPAEGLRGGSQVTTNAAPVPTTSAVALTQAQIFQRHFQAFKQKSTRLPMGQSKYVHDIPTPDYEDSDEEERRKEFPAPKCVENNKEYDDPYYCGFQARVPSFIKRKAREPLVPTSIRHRQSVGNYSLYGARRYIPR